MWLPLIGLIFGVLLGAVSTLTIPIFYAKYLSIAVLAAMDSLLGGWRAILEDHFDGPILVSGFLTNAIIAALLAYMGDILGLDLYLAAVVTFGLRIFSNIGFIRRYTILRYRKNKEDKQKTQEQVKSESAKLAAIENEDEIPTYGLISKEGASIIPPLNNHEDGCNKTED